MDISTDSLVLPTSHRKIGSKTNDVNKATNKDNKSDEAIVVDRKKYVDPPDGGWGWVIVLGVWVDNILVIGMLKSLGVLFPEFRNYFQGSAGAISWINSISLSMRATGAPLAAALSNRFGDRPVVIAGGVLVVAGMMISQFAQSPQYLYVSMGIISGLGFALASLPALTMIGRYFKVKRSLANGLSRSGGAATFFIAPLLQYLISSFGWQGCIFIIGAIEMNLWVCASLFRPLRLKQELEFDYKKTLDKHRQSKIEEKNIKQLQHRGGLESFYRRDMSEKDRKKEVQKAIETRVENNGVTESLMVDHFPHMKLEYEKKNVKLLHFSLLKNPLWITLTTNLVLTQFGYAITLVHLVARANILGIGEYESVFLLSYIGITEVTAQLTSGWFADKGYIRRIHLHKIYITLMTLATFISLFTKSYLGMSIYCLMFGIGSGSWQGNILPVTVDTLGLKNLRSAYGFSLFFSGVVGQMLGPPIAGMLFDSTGSYTASFILATCSLLVASLVLWFEIPAKKYVDKRTNLKNRRKSACLSEDDVKALYSEIQYP